MGCWLLLLSRQRSTLRCFRHCRRVGPLSRQRSALRCSGAVCCARGAEKACFRSGAVFHGAAGKSFAARRSAGALTPLASPSPLANGPKGLTVAEKAPEISPEAERCTLRTPLAGEPVKDLRQPRAQPTDSGTLFLPPPPVAEEAPAPCATPPPRFHVETNPRPATTLFPRGNNPPAKGLL